MTDPKWLSFPASSDILIEEARAARQPEQAAKIKAHLRIVLGKLKSRSSKA